MAEKVPIWEKVLLTLEEAPSYTTGESLSGV